MVLRLRMATKSAAGDMAFAEHATVQTVTLGAAGKRQDVTMFVRGEAGLAYADGDVLGVHIEREGTAAADNAGVVHLLGVTIDYDAFGPLHNTAPAKPTLKFNPTGTRQV